LILTEYFSQYGHVDHVDLIEDRATKRLRGFAYVTFNDYDPVDKAVCKSIIPVMLLHAQLLDCRSVSSLFELDILDPRAVETRVTKTAFFYEKAQPCWFYWFFKVKPGFCKEAQLDTF